MTQRSLRTDETHGEHGVFVAEFGARIYVATLDGKKSKATQSSSVHRIKFSVPISYQASKFDLST